MLIKLVGWLQQNQWKIFSIADPTGWDPTDICFLLLHAYKDQHEDLHLKTVLKVQIKSCLSQICHGCSSEVLRLI